MSRGKRKSEDNLKEIVGVCSESECENDVDDGGKFCLFHHILKSLEKISDAKT